MELGKSADGSNVLERDSKLGLWVAGVGTIVLDSLVNTALDALTHVDPSAWRGWWTTLASAGIATAVGFLTAYKAKRYKGR